MFGHGHGHKHPTPPTTTPEAEAAILDYLVCFLLIVVTGGMVAMIGRVCYVSWQQSTQRGDEEELMTEGGEEEAYGTLHNPSLSRTMFTADGHEVEWLSD